MLLTNISNILCYDESVDKKKEDLKSPLHIRAAKGRMRDRVGNANEMEIKKKIYR